MELFQKKFKVAFCGTPEFVLPVVETLFSLDSIDLCAVISQPDKPSDGNKMATPAVARWANSQNIKLLQPPALKDPAFKELFASLQLDAVIVFAYGQLIPQSVLQIPKMGWVNIHPSLLPEYRGATPMQSAIRDNKKNSGVSLMLLDKGMDTGPIIFQKKIGIDREDTTLSLRSKMVKLACELLQTQLISYLSGKIAPLPQDNAKATITKPLTKDQGHIVWQQTAEQIIQMIKAFEPWPGCWTISKIGALRILKGAVGPKLEKKPGTIFVHEKNLCISCGEQTSLLILKILREGKNRQTENLFF